MSDYSPAFIMTASSGEAMQRLGAALGHHLRMGDAVLLYGDLGAGKTTFVRGLVQAISLEADDVVSPTFTLVQTYETTHGVLYHYDLYRLLQGDAATLTELGWDEALTHGITLVEWSERLTADFVPIDALHIHIAHLSDARELTFTGNDLWRQRLHHLHE